MLFVPFPLSLRSVAYLLHERGVDISREPIRFWWHRFGLLFAAGVCMRQFDGMKSSV